MYTTTYDHDSRPAPVTIWHVLRKQIVHTNEAAGIVITFNGEHTFQVWHLAGHPHPGTTEVAVFSVWGHPLTHEQAQEQAKEWMLDREQLT